uniref:RBR-type E3 ubiquitin transferase n=1 Tax=Aegilops tauschii subsp. strangulata TaxID=200361 RepID=A0A453KWY9_AEGTS
EKSTEESPRDRKGKRKLLEEDEPSGSGKRRKRNRFRCAICMEKVQVSEQFIVSHCSHAFCNGCVGRYVATKIGENVESIGCPDPECTEGFVEIEPCRDIIPQELFDRWSVTLCEQSLGNEKYYCPFKDCSALLIKDNDRTVKIRDTECPHCHRMFCARCRVPWHDGIKCKELRKLGDDEKGETDLMLKKLANKKKWQRCPSCKMYVSKIDGCLLMKCSTSVTIALLQ